MKDKAIIKKAEFKDLSKMLLVLRTASEENEIEGLPPLLDNDSVRWISNFMTTPKTHTLNGVIDGRIVGTLGLREYTPDWNSEKPILQSEWFGVINATERKHSVAAKLVDHAIDVANQCKLGLLFSGITFLKDAVSLFGSRNFQSRGGFYILPYEGDSAVFLDGPPSPIARRNPPRNLSEISDNDFVEGKNGRLSLVTHTA